MSEGYTVAEIPDEFKALRACLRCGLVKTLTQFHENGCENCIFLQLEGNTPRIHECTTAYFEGMVAMIDPEKSWVAKWQRIATYYPGMYAIDVVGELPDDVLEYCEEHALEFKAGKKQ
eukprot:gene3083-3371_t